VLYWNSGTYHVYINETRMQANFFDSSIGKQAELIGDKGCGEHRFVGGVDNYLEFILTTNCRLEVREADSFPATVRMDWTLDEFYGDGGHTAFADRVAGVLGIHASRIKVVNVYKGSVVVDFSVEEEDEEEQTEGVETEEGTQEELIVENGNSTNGTSNATV